MKLDQWNINGTGLDQPMEEGTKMNKIKKTIQITGEITV
jgi:hypothetical protein